MPDTIITQRCKTCGIIKPISEFNLQRNAGALVVLPRRKCRTCEQAVTRQWRRAHPERMKLQVRNYNDRHRAAVTRRIRDYVAQHAEQRKKTTKAWDERNRDKRRAQSALRNAVRVGRIIRMPCEKCGNSKSEAHHEDYGKPLEVNWLCRRCHGLKHRKPL